MTRTRRVGLAIAGAILLSSAGLLSAGGTQSFRQTTAKEFEEGEATASVILPTGEVVPGLRATRVPLEAAFVWCSATSADGKTAYFGTGDQGRVFSVKLRDGNTAPSARRLADIGVPWVTALAVRPDGTLLAGSTPGGRVYVVDPAKGDSRQLAKLQAEHVWSLAHDPKTGITYAGTGGPGKVFSIDARGSVKQLWDSGDKQVVSLVSFGGGVLYAGTSNEGVLYRVEADGRAIALHDFEADEVRAILRVGNATYVAVNDFVGVGSAAPASSTSTTTTTTVTSSSAAAAAKGTRISSGPGGTTATAAPGGGRGGAARGRGAVYRLDDAGGIEQVFSLSDGYLTALLADGTTVLAAAGTQGKVYRLLPDRTFALAADLSERQALTLLRAGDGFLVGTGDVGGVYEVRPAGAGDASYLSKVFDGDFFTRWGRLRWMGSPNLQFETRSGNTAKPDRSWTGWKKLEAVGWTGADGEGQIASGGSRYVQYKVALPDKNSALKEVSLFYLPQNQRPRVTDVYLAEPPASTSGATARVHSSTLKLRWRVDNPDGDSLVYRLGYRQESEAVWRQLGGPDPLTKAEYDWNTDSVPDGLYLIRVWVTDERSNSSDRQLDSTFVSAPFLVDNTRPEVRDLSVQANSKPPVIVGRARDNGSVIDQVEYSVDGDDWRPATPGDGLYDQRVENFAIRLGANLAKGPHVVNIRAWDAADNLGAGRIQVEVK
jgi:hypothetical protein